MNEEYSREAVFEELGQTVPEAEMQRAESYADLKLRDVPLRLVSRSFGCGSGEAARLLGLHDRAMPIIKI